MDLIRFIFRLLKRLLVLAIIFGGVYLYFNNDQVQATTNRDIWYLHDQIAQVVDRYFPQQAKGTGLAHDYSAGSSSSSASSSSNSGQAAQSQSTSQSSSSQTDVPTTGRWPSNNASVYVNTGSQELDNAANQAIQAWNQTGAFTFNKTTDRSKADIIVSAMNNDSTNAAGLTKSTSNALTNRFTHANVYLNVHYLTDPAYGYTQERIVNTAEHELGHAIGLDHTNAVSVMQPAGSFYSIQPRDVQTVRQLYAKSSSNS